LFSEPELLVAVCVALANGLMQNWLPQEQVKSLQVPNLPNESVLNEKQARKGNLNTGGNPQTKVTFSLSAEAQVEIKKALEVINITYWG
jgi:hypothetical protein